MEVGRPKNHVSHDSTTSLGAGQRCELICQRMESVKQSEKNFFLQVGNHLLAHSSSSQE